MAIQMIDLSFPRSGAIADVRVARAQMPKFVSDVRRVIATAPAAALGVANTVTVSPGGQTYPTITAALNAITDASIRKQYVVSIGPGTYNEIVACKPYVYLQGAGADQTTVTAGATDSQADKGTVRGCSNSAVQNMTIVSTGNGFGCWATAVDCNSAVNFDIENCNLLSIDTVGGANMCALAIDYSTIGSGSQVNVSYSAVTANCPANQSQPLALLTGAGGYVQVMESKLIATGGSGGWGGASNGGSTLIVDFSYVAGDGFSLNIPDYSSTCIANNCQLVGPVQNGVQVNQNTPPAGNA